MSERVVVCYCDVACAFAICVGNRPVSWPARVASKQTYAIPKCLFVPHFLVPLQEHRAAKLTSGA